MSVLMPTVIEHSNRGERAYDIYSRFFRDRIIFLGMPIDVLNGAIFRFPASYRVHLEQDEQR